jgi:hypothetical protein
MRTIQSAMPPAASIQDIAVIVGPTAAAIAAAVSLMSVRLTRAIAHDATLPDLSTQPVSVNGQAGAVIHNAGSGVARGVHFIIVHGGYRAVGFGGNGGILRPDEICRAITSIPLETGAKVDALIVGCRDRYGNAHDWTHEERHIERRGTWGQRPEYGTLESRLHEIDPELSLGNLAPSQVKVYPS